MSKKALWVQTVVFLLFIALFFILNLVLPDKSFSERENRALQTAPKFSFSDLFAGKFATRYEDYVTDQFTLRDSWTELKARCEMALGKAENNGVYLCENETLISAFEEPNFNDVDFSLNAIETLANSTDADVYFALIPTASEIWNGMLPKGTPNCSQTEFIAYCYGQVTGYSDAKCIDMYDALNSHADEAIYYRTDHHWTTLGAYYGYTALAKAMGFDAKPLDSYTVTQATDSFYGTTYSSSGYGWVKPDSIETRVQQGDVKILNYPVGQPVESKLYDESFLSKKDKYSYFYGGNTPLVEITTGNEGGHILILRDSYMDSLSPYLFDNFAEIDIVDLRYYKTPLSAYIAENDIDTILVCYSVPNFATDGNIFMAAR